MAPTPQRNDDAQASSSDDHLDHSSSSFIPKNQELHLTSASQRDLIMLARSRPRNHRVRFSESSMLYMYHEDPTYVKSSMSSTSADRKVATENALREAIRIKRKLLSTPNKARGGPGCSLDEHLDRCGIAREDIVGIDHLVLEDPARMLGRRRNHVRVILMEQENQRRQGQGRCTDEYSRRLAQMSFMLAKRPRKQARSRAAMAA